MSNQLSRQLRQLAVMAIKVWNRNTHDSDIQREQKWYTRYFISKFPNVIEFPSYVSHTPNQLCLNLLPLMSHIQFESIVPRVSTSSQINYITLERPWVLTQLHP